MAHGTPILRPAFRTSVLFQFAITVISLVWPVTVYGLEVGDFVRLGKPDRFDFSELLESDSRILISNIDGIPLVRAVYPGTSRLEFYRYTERGEIRRRELSERAIVVVLPPRRFRPIWDLFVNLTARSCSVRPTTDLVHTAELMLQRRR